MNKQQILKAAMGLGLDDRMEVVDGLIASVGPKERDEIDKAWAKEAESRLHDLEHGKAKGIPAPEVFKQLRAKFAK